MCTMRYLENFAGKLAESGRTWWDFDENFATQAIKEAVEGYAATYGETVLYSSARNEYAITLDEQDPDPDGADTAAASEAGKLSAGRL